MAFGFLQRGSLAGQARLTQLSSYQPCIQLEALVRGVDNLRHDVALSTRFTEVTRQHIFRLITKHGQVEALIDEQSSTGRPQSRIAQPSGGGNSGNKSVEAGEFKRVLLGVHVSALNRAKVEGNISVDLLARLAAVKLQRSEMQVQFALALERGRAKLKTYEGPRQLFAHKGVEMRERFAKFQISKKAVLRKVGQDLFATIREIEKESLSRMRRSLFGDAQSSTYDLFLNRLLYTEDGRDDYLNAEQYVMLGNYERDPDRFETMQSIACDFLRALQVSSVEAEEDLDLLLNVPENAHELFGGGTPNESEKGKAQRALLNGWVELLEKENVIDHVIASYEVVPLLAEYSPPINPQQLKNALISKTERTRVEGLLEEHGKISTDNLNTAVKKVDSCKGLDRAKVAARFFADFLRYHRDHRRFEALNSAMDAVNVIGTERLRELSAINNTLYEFLLPEEQRSGEEKVLRHVILKADIRESTTLTRTLHERGLNPASYFSLNFYDPINKLLPKYEASTVFIEGDAVILAIFEREGEAGFGVARTCVLAKEMIGIVSAYNEQSQKQGLPALELGIGISYQDSAPMYLVYGSQRIMISKALNESDRLSSCSKGARRFAAGKQTPFSVFSLQTVQDKDISGNPDEFLVRYNISGVLISTAAFEKLSQEISLEEHSVKLPTIWPGELVKLFSGTVPIASGLFHKIVVREGAIPHVDAATMTVKDWMPRKYYEVCVNQEVYDLLDKPAAAAAGVGK
jgi:class 3 adenylate cyclase